MVISKKLLNINFLLEVELLRKVPNAVAFFALGKEYFLSGIYCCTLFNWSEIAVDLKQAMKHVQFSNGQKRFLLIELLMGLELLHSRGIILCNLQRQNIFIYYNKVKIGNFSFACYEHLSHVVKKRYQEFPYSGPDQINCDLPITVAVDMWSFGILACELQTNLEACPFPRLPNENIQPFFIQSTINQLVQSLDLDETFRLMVLSCLQADPAQRIQSSKLKLNSLFHSVNRKLFL